MNLSASVIGLAAGLAVAVAAGGFWTWFVRYRQLKDRTAAIGWWIILGWSWWFSFWICICRSEKRMKTEQENGRSRCENRKTAR